MDAVSAWAGDQVSYWRNAAGQLKTQYQVGQTVEAFHPGRFGVVNTGTIVEIGRKYLYVDFGPLLGGVWRVHPEHVTSS